MANLGSFAAVKVIYMIPVAARSDVPDGLTSGDLVALAGEAGGMTAHVHNGVYKVQAGAWEKLAANTSTRYHVMVGSASTSGTGSLTDGLYVMRCTDVSAGKYGFVRL